MIDSELKVGLAFHGISCPALLAVLRNPEGARLHRLVPIILAVLFDDRRVVGSLVCLWLLTSDSSQPWQQTWPHEHHSGERLPRWLCYTSR